MDIYDGNDQNALDVCEPKNRMHVTYTVTY